MVRLIVFIVTFGWIVFRSTTYDFSNSETWNEASKWEQKNFIAPTSSLKTDRKLDSINQNTTAAEANNDPKSEWFDQQNEVLNVIKSNFNPTNLIAYLSHPSDYVKEAALIKLSQFPPNAEAYLKISDALFATHSARMVKLLLVELNKYPNLKSKTMDAYFKLLQTGPVLIREELAGQSISYIDPNNLKSFQSILSQTPRHTKRYRLLKSSIDQFTKQFE